MSRTLVPLLLAVAIGSGCAVSPPVQVAEQRASEGSTSPSVQQWLSLQQDVAAMNSKEIVEKLVRVNRPEGPGQLYYYGLLNQQLETVGAWAQARDTFKQLQQDEALVPEQRQLVGILLEYNQNRINCHKRKSELLKQQSQLQEKLLEAEQEKLLLEQKIQALTELETVISTRKEE